MQYYHEPPPFTSLSRQRNLTSESVQNKYALFVDFDGTITTEDIGDKIVTTFADDGWQETERQFSAGKISLRLLADVEVQHLRKEREAEAAKFAIGYAKFRSRFEELIEYCESHDVVFEVVSSGMHFYIDPVLEKHGLQRLQRSRPIVKYDSEGRGIHVMPDGIEDCDFTPMCKCARADFYRGQGYRVIFAGNGSSDRCVAPKVDHLFSTDGLTQYCESERIEHSHLEDFHEVLGELKRLI